MRTYLLVVLLMLLPATVAGNHEGVAQQIGQTQDMVCTASGAGLPQLCATPPQQTVRSGEASVFTLTGDPRICCDIPLLLSVESIEPEPPNVITRFEPSDFLGGFIGVAETRLSLTITQTGSYKVTVKGTVGTGEVDAKSVFLPILLTVLPDPLTAPADLVVPQDCATIQACIDAAQPGAVIAVSSGTYEENLTIEKSLTLRGEGAGPKEVRILATGSDRPVLLIDSGEVIDVRIANLIITGFVPDGLGGDNDDGIQVAGRASVKLQSIVINRNDDNGLVVRDFAQATLINSSVSGNSDNGLVVEDSAQATLINSSVSGNFNGLVVVNSAQATLTDSTVSDNGDDGLFVGGSARLEVRDNTIEANQGCGIFSTSTQLVQGTGNVMRDNGNDLCGNLSAELRVPLRPETESEILFSSTEFSFLQEAIDALQPGGTLLLAPESVQVGGVMISKPLTIRVTSGVEEGKAATLRGQTDRAPVLSLIEGAKVEIEGLLITQGRDGVLLGSNAQATLAYSIVSDNSGGLEVRDSAQATLTDSTVSDNDFNGLEVFDSAQATLTDSTISGNGRNYGRNGLVVRDFAQATLTDSTVSGNGDNGLIVEDSAQATLTNSIVSDNGRNGLALGKSAQATLTNSSVSGNGRNGLAVEHFAQATLTGSTVSDNGDNGLDVFDSAQATLTNSTISGNGRNDLIVEDSARLEARDSTIEANQGCGILSTSSQLVQGTGNRMHDNGNDLCGNISAKLRVPLRLETESEILFSPTEFSSLQEAVDALEPGGTLLLAPESVQTGGVTISKPLTIRVTSGAKEGKAATIQGQTDRAPVLSLIEGAKVEIEGLRITQGANGVLLGSNAQVTLANSIVSDNFNGLEVWDSAQATLTGSTVSGNFNGLKVRDSAQATLTNSTISGNGRIGLYVFDSAQATLTDSTISDNSAGTGLVVGDSAQATLTGSTVSGNFKGLFVVNSAQATLANSTVSDNSGGLEVWDSAQATLTNSTVSGNDFNGLVVKDSAQVILTNSTVSGHRRNGLEVRHSAQATLTNSTVSDNGHNGLFVRDSAQATLNASTVSDNRSNGLELMDSAQATLTNSIVSGNRDNGLELIDSAQATLTNSIVSDNSFDGLALIDSAQATLTNSTVSDNTHNGLELIDSARLEVRDNTIEANQGCGILSTSSQLVQGTGNRMRDNGNDLCGDLSAKLRVPLRPETESEILFSPTEFSSLQEAVDALEPGGTLLLAPESVQVGGMTIAKSLIIRVSGAKEGKVATIQGQTDRAPVLSLIEGAKVEIEGLLITQGKDGVLLSGNAQVTLTTNSAIADNRVFGLVVRDSAQATLTNSTVSGNFNGLVVEDSAQATLTNSTVSDNRDNGLKLMDSARLEMQDNTIEANQGCGISSTSSQLVQGTGNRMRDNGNDLCGDLSAKLRVPLRPETESEILFSPTEFSSLQEAVDALQPGGTLLLAPESVQVGGVTIAKPLVIRVSGAKEGKAATIQGRTDRAPVLSLIEGAKVEIEGLLITQGRDGVLLSGNAQVTLATNSAVADNRGFGLVVGDSAQATLINSTVSGNSVGLIVEDSAQATLTDSSVSGNAYNGLVVEHSAQATLTNSSISGNGRNGLVMEDSAQATLTDSIVRNNADWGIVAKLERCGFDEDDFTGLVVFEGTNTVEGNNTSGDQDRLGNPGDHSFKDRSSGQVCLP